ncbi:MAG: HAMP domain-containing histidine kinase [Flavobacteriales bacterium]|nr:HAMP domain-containing histidine kinase [Flavobacteriales bacterium]
MKASAEQTERLHRFAHDLRNRLIGLQQVLEQFRAGPPEADRQELALFGEQQFFKALREVEDVMDDLGVERGVVKPAFGTVRIAELVRTHVDLMQYRLQRKRQMVELDLDEDLETQADARLLGDVLDALISNASKFSEAGSAIAITSSTDGIDAVITVKDNGTGLSTEDLERVFVRFAWLGNRPTGGESQGRGTLARARAWMIAQGGGLSAESPGEGLGCTFTARLPLRRTGIGP